jgi:CubicO group peptidase (beta-lactamase class C family)
MDIKNNKGGEMTMRTHYKAIVFAAVVVLSSMIVMPRLVFANSKAQKIDELLNIYHEYNRFNGTVLVAQKGEVIFKKGYGYADIEWGIENEPHMKFRIGSITKQFTSMLIMQLVEAKKIKLDARIIDYLPDFRKDTGDRITIHNLLTHTSGIPNFTNIPGFWSDSIRVHYSLDRLVYELCAGDLEFEPGSTFRYSNSNYIILGAIIENVSGKPYEEMLREKILMPLEMENTGIDNFQRIIEDRAAGYERRGNVLINASYIYMQNAYAAGAMYSTVEDLFIWDQALYTNKLLGNKYKKKMFTPFLGNYAYGWGVYKVGFADNTGFNNSEDSVKLIAHSGGITGFTSLIQRFPEDRYTIILCDNTGSGFLSEISRALRNILYDKPYDMPKRSVSEAIYPIVLDQGIEAAIDHYHMLRQEHPDEYDFSENELNNLGYVLLGLNRVKDAIAIFELNVEMYSEGYNTYDSLGEAYMNDGQYDLAIQNYAKSLELNPENTNAINQLQRINEQR